MPNVAILTPDPADEGFRTRWREVFERLVQPLRQHGLKVEGRAWSDGSDLTAFDLVLPLLAWGYHRAGRQWIEAVTRWERDGVKLQNGPAVLCWNADKAYLARLAKSGAPVPPSLYVERLTESALAEAVEAFGTEQLIAKPRISASAWQTIRWSPGRSFEGGPTGPAMIQPYLPEIERSGEISLIYLGGRFSHAIAKVPQPGDFRVQPEYDGIITPYRPFEDEFAAAEACLDGVEENLLYARIDLVRDLENRPVLMELELVEPDLYLGYDERAPDAFAEAVARASVAP